MKILGIDTSTNSCSVAVLNQNDTLSEINIDNNLTHSKYLMDAIDSALRFSGLNFNELDGFAITVGPGSFTGLRIGLSTIKGLSVASAKPIVGVSSLDSMAYPLPFIPTLIVPLIDARKGEVYYSKYKFINGVIHKEMNDMLDSPEKAIAGIKESCLFIGNGSDLYKSLILNKFGKFAFFLPDFYNKIRASVVARIGLEKIKNSGFDDSNLIIPKYIRKSDVELKK
ncbi:MAG: tRNA (adenosine(37)-N6)-threonylcarbamoyltransferase complex dimerization subunit type 1 TsaB [Desulfobacterales bacterium]|nr:tRNA (adenosine(37)-N6)-threonylcarbamoyltransferase complex dimerization subunit type 1 TsaB [Desulfobacterales bacterium]